MKFRDFYNKNKGFALAMLVLFMFRWSLADQYRVPSGSMEPGIQIGDHILVSKVAYDFKIPFTEISIFKTTEPERGDVVTFIWPGDNSTIFVKRLIGLPGDRIEIKNGFIKINGTPVEGSSSGEALLARTEQNYIYKETLAPHQYEVQRSPTYATPENLNFVVPEGNYFFMGDNRDNSADSRRWGFVKREALKGRAERVLWNVTLNPLRLDLTRVGKFL